MKAAKGCVESIASTLNSEATEPPITYLYPPSKVLPYSTKEALYTGIDVTGLIAMKSTLESLLQHLKIQGTLPHTWPPNHHGQL